MNEHRILIVEDDPVVLLSLEETLKKKGWSTRVAATPTGALDEFRDFRPDVVLMDVNLEVEHDGILVAHSIREQGDTPIVFLTGHNDPETFEKARETIPYGFISKPVQNSQLCRTLDLALTQLRERQKTKPAQPAFASALTKLQYAVFTVNLKGEIASWNHVAADALGEQVVAKGALLGRTLQASSTDEAALIGAIAKAAQNGESSDLTQGLNSLNSAWESIMVSPLEQRENESVMVLLRKRTVKDELGKVREQDVDPLTKLPFFCEESLRTVPETAACVIFHAQNYLAIRTRMGRQVADEVMLTFTGNISRFFEGIEKTFSCGSNLFRAPGPLIAATLDADAVEMAQVLKAIDHFMSNRRSSVLDLASQPGTLVSVSASHLLLPPALRDQWIREANKLRDRKTV